MTETTLACAGTPMFHAQGVSFYTTAVSHGPLGSSVHSNAPRVLRSQPELFWGCSCQHHHRSFRRQKMFSITQLQREPIMSLLFLLSSRYVCSSIWGNRILTHTCRSGLAIHARSII